MNEIGMMAMEFKYKLSSWKIRRYWLVPLVVLVYSAVFYKFGFVDVVDDLFYFVNFSLIGLAYYKFYRQANNIVIRVDDFEVSHEANGNLTTILWKDVTKVSWEQTVITSILIRSKQNQITIGKDIEGFSQIIQYTKQMVGDRFITYDVSLEPKYPIQNFSKQQKR